MFIDPKIRNFTDAKSVMSCLSPTLSGKVSEQGN
jgi:hypothetical protein